MRNKLFALLLTAALLFSATPALATGETESDAVVSATVVVETWTGNISFDFSNGVGVSDIPATLKGSEEEMATIPASMAGAACAYDGELINNKHSDHTSTDGVMWRNEVEEVLEEDFEHGSGLSKQISGSFNAVGGEIIALGVILRGPDKVTSSRGWAEVSCTLYAEASIVIEKMTNGEDADEPTGPKVLTGDEVEWIHAATNNGEVGLTDVIVTDDDANVTLELIDKADGDDILSPGETWVYRAVGVSVAGQYSNLGTVVATATGIDGKTVQVSDDDPSHYYGVTPVVVPTGSGLMGCYWDWEADGSVFELTELVINDPDGVVTKVSHVEGPLEDHDGTALTVVVDYVDEWGLPQKTTFVVDGREPCPPPGADFGATCTLIDILEVDEEDETLFSGSVFFNRGHDDVLEIEITDMVLSDTVDVPEDLQIGMFDTWVTSPTHRMVSSERIHVDCRPAIIGDDVWFDDNENKVKDAGEKGVSGATVRVTNQETGDVTTWTTNANGKYFATDLVAGTYRVEILTATLPDNHDLTTVDSYTVTVDPGDEFLNADFGIVEILPVTGVELETFTWIGLLFFGLAGLMFRLERWLKRRSRGVAVA